MSLYTDCICDKCKEKFDINSDVVVCPICGTPHHRGCYNQLKHCVNENKHNSGFEWCAPDNPVKTDTIICPKCGKENNNDSSFCENCGVAISSNTNSVAKEYMQTQTNSFNERYTPHNTLDGDIDGVSYKDMAIYIGSAAPYYITNFKRKQLSDKKAKSFCWSAFWFDGLYFLYRKMWVEAILIILLTFVLSIPSLIVTFNTLGMMPANYPVIFDNITVLRIFSFLSIGFKLYLGFSANSIYKNKVVRSIKKIKKNTHTEQEYYQALVDNSGPCAYVLYGAIGLMLVYLFI